MSDNIRIEKKSDTLPDFVKKVLSTEQQFKIELLLKIAAEFINTIKFVAPRDTGNYANSWVVQKVDSNSVTIATPKGALAIMLEFGTAPHPIFPKRKKFLRWEDPSGEHFAIYVRHPGFPAKPHIRPAINVLETRIPEIAKELLKKYYKS